MVVLGFLLFVGLPTLKAQNMCPSVVIKQQLEPTTAAVIQGTVQDKAGQSLTKIELTLTGSEKPKLEQTATTDDKGQFHFNSVPAGKYKIAIRWSSGTAKHTQVQCDTNGVCQVAFTLKPPRVQSVCREPSVDNDLRSGMRQ
jgi:protocatechuate 3,4-dioxygenase beta subunit